MTATSDVAYNERSVVAFIYYVMSMRYLVCFLQFKLFLSICIIPSLDVNHYILTLVWLSLYSIGFYYQECLPSLKCLPTHSGVVCAMASRNQSSATYD